MPRKLYCLYHEKDFKLLKISSSKRGLEPLLNVDNFVRVFTGITKTQLQKLTYLQAVRLEKDLNDSH